MLSHILEDIGVDNAQLLVSPGSDNGTVQQTVIVDAEDESPVHRGTLVLLIGARGRAAMPSIRRLIPDYPTAVAVKGSEEELDAVRELLQPTGIALIAVSPDMSWSAFEGIA